jgi:uncharacterized protein (DUF885 family)
VRTETEPKPVFAEFPSLTAMKLPLAPAAIVVVPPEIEKGVPSPYLRGPATSYKKLADHATASHVTSAM